MRTDPGKRDGPFVAGREKDAVAASQGGSPKHNGTRAFVKAWIVRLALWGWLPSGLATWLIQRGGMRHE